MNTVPVGEAFANGRPAHAAADLRGVQIELGQGAAEGVAVHAKFFGGLALVAFVMREHLKDVTFLELANRLVIGNPGTMHLSNQNIQFALQGYLHRDFAFLREAAFTLCNYFDRLIQSGALCFSSCAPCRMCC